MVKRPKTGIKDHDFSSEKNVMTTVVSPNSKYGTECIEKACKYFIKSGKPSLKIRKEENNKKSKGGMKYLLFK